MSSELQPDTPAQDDEQNPPDAADRAALFRQRATDVLDVIKERTAAMLAERRIAYPVFFLVPGSGDGILVIGTTVEPDPSDQEWEMVTEAVGEIVRETIGLEGTRARDVACAFARAAI